MPRVVGGRRSTYLLLSGLVVPRPVRLAANIGLLPIDPKCMPRPFLANLELLDQQFALLLLPWIESQIKVTGSGARDVATRAWNALWDVLLLSAIYAVPIDCGLQSSCRLERFDEKSRLNVIHYRLFALPDSKVLTLSENDCRWLENHFERAQDLMSDHRFQNAVHCLATYHWHSLPRARLALLWAGIEGLFGIENEIAFRVSLHTAKFLAPNAEDEQRTVFDTVRRLYTIRSKAVHGGKMKGEPAEAVVESVSLLSRLVRACVEQNQLPDLGALTL